ncbi:hypothetical protein AEQ67_26375 [Pseudomonas sp. RIT-PI-q]|nr:hypothetical protein AEQ67_26375 [Pseudomonas sp. RIT-PI-q]
MAVITLNHAATTRRLRGITSQHRAITTSRGFINRHRVITSRNEATTGLIRIRGGTAVTAATGTTTTVVTMGATIMADEATTTVVAITMAEAAAAKIS